MISPRRFAPCLIILFWLSCAGGAARAETLYDQPWLGEWPDFWTKFAAPSSDELAGDIAAADDVVVATAVTLAPTEDARGRTTYTAQVRVAEVIKSKDAALAGRALQLSWKANTTGIEIGARHLFFLKRGGEGAVTVLRSAYLYDSLVTPDMRLFWAMNCDAAIGMDVVRHLAGGKVPADLGERMASEFRTGAPHARSSVILMACALDKALAVPTLRMAVEPDERGRIELDDYRRAAYRLAEIDGSAGVEAILAGLGRIDGKRLSRISESIAFSAVGRSGDQSCVAAVKAAVKAHPEWAVSAAFALAEIGGTDAMTAIRDFRADPSLASRTTSSAGRLEPRHSFAELFDQAHRRAREKPKKP